MEYYFNFCSEKNHLILETRGICFEHIITLINEGCILDVVAHPNQIKYPKQSMYIVDVDGYCYLVPYVKNDKEIFLKTIIPSRKATKQYLSNQTKKSKRDE